MKTKIKHLIKHLLVLEVGRESKILCNKKGVLNTNVTISKNEVTCEDCLTILEKQFNYKMFHVEHK
jgi:hypothetical protein